MQRFSAATAFAVASIGLLTACSGNSPTPGSFLTAAVARRPAPATACTDKTQLYVANFGDNDVLVICNETFEQVGEITDGVDRPTDVSLDQNANLYVANFSNATIAEYAPSKFSAPSFTYSAGMVEPETLTVDTQGDVFEGDANGAINEYSQGHNSVTTSCSPGGGVTGVAVDAKGDVFVEYFSSSLAKGVLAEYEGGLSGCKETGLTPTFQFNGGIAVDKKRDLIVCDASQVDVIDPPYTRISGTIGSGFSGARGVSLNKKNNLALVADTSANTVTLINYPAGSNKTVLTSGLSEPEGVVDSPNAVY